MGSAKNKIFLSVVIPAYNEEKVIAYTLEETIKYLKSQKYSYEIIVIDDGSRDSTWKKITDISDKENHLITIRNEINRGKGSSIKEGVEKSTGEYVLFTDGDFSTDIKEIEKLFPWIEKGHDIAIGSRVLENSNLVVRQPIWREMMGKTFNIFIKLILMMGYHDTQCGFKLFRGDLARKLFSELQIKRFSFDVEIIYRAIRKKYKVKEVGICWSHYSTSRVHPIKSSMQMLRDLIRIKYFKMNNNL